MKPSTDIARLIEIMAALRTPGSGCPWDLEQTFASIAPYTIEEAYEVADAIQRGDITHLKDELGDLLLQVVYHARMAEETGAFEFGDVVEVITSKMIRRHPHVFGDAQAVARGAEDGFWARIKAEEKAAKNSGAGREPDSLLDDIPSALPGLTRAVKLQNKAAGVGFDWPSLEPVFDKLREELAELEEVALPADPRGSDPRESAEQTAKIEEEFGDLLFVVANVARHLKLDPEAALRGANEKFVRRFRHIERRLDEQGRSPAQSDLSEMDALWDEAKAHERGEG
jgi:nucleoside triphosphate diphosphatase